MNREFNKEFIADVIERYSDMLIRIALNYTRNLQDAEDIAQDVFMSLMLVPQIENASHLKAWLIRVTINKAKDLLRSARKKRTLPLESAKNCFVKTEDTASVLDSLEKLKPKDRIIVYLFYIEGYTAKEIGDMVELKERAVLVRLSRSRAKLRTCMYES